MSDFGIRMSFSTVNHEFSHALVSSFRWLNICVGGGGKKLGCLELGVPSCFQELDRVKELTLF